MLENDRTIFSYLKPCDNDMISLYKGMDLNELLSCLDKYYLEYRDTINIEDNNTFGIEVEVEKFITYDKYGYVNFNKKIDKIVGNKKWDVRGDISLVDGAEIVSEVLIDNIKNWENIKNVCRLISLYGEIDINCSAHIHVGSQLLGENTAYWYRFFKLWSVYENIIYRFCYGEYLSHRPGIMDYARPVALFYDSKLKQLENELGGNVLNMIKMLEPNTILYRYMNKTCISHRKMLFDNNYCRYEDFDKIVNGCTFELRAPNGTLDEVIWQNNINVFIKMINYCKSDKFNYDVIDKRRIELREIFSFLPYYSLIYLDQAIEFCDMIFDNNLDKLYFLRQYLKNSEVSYEPFVKAKKFTYSNK